VKKVLLTVFALALVAPLYAQQAPPIEVPWNDAIPPGTADHAARALKESSRHQEWVKIKLSDGTDFSAFVVYPERKDKAGVVLVIHDIHGMADIPRAAADQLAQDGFIAIVPDFLSGKGPNGGGTESFETGSAQAIIGLADDEVNARLNAAMEYGIKLPSSNGKTGVVGFCWGGQKSFGYAISQSALNASVVYYGDIPGFSGGAAALEPAIAKIKAPVLGLYAGNDARIDMTLELTAALMKKAGKSYETHTFEGAGHAFMGSQAGAAGANLKAAQESWPMVLGFLRTHLK